jgi:putative glutamine amidotransferase
MVGHHPFHMAGEKYVTAIRDAADAMPLLIPVLKDPIPSDDLLATFDGFLFPGSPSNVSPSRYEGSPPREDVLLDENRDATSLPLLMAAIAAGAPVLCICRGFQELNVALGGTLFQHVHEVPGRHDHREDKNAGLDTQYGPAHEVLVAEDGLLAQITSRRSFHVNSLHGQGLDRLSPSLHADATAPDGTIEAVSMPEAKGFLLGLQWHPEWRWHENEISRAILGAFGEAVHERAQR